MNQAHGTYAFIKPALVVYVKNYNRLPVKTRLARSLTMQCAKDFYRMSLDCLSESLKQLAPYFTIFISPSSHLDVPWAHKKWPKLKVFPQKQADNLGDRLQDSANQLLTLGYPGVFIIGSDAPDLPFEYIIDSSRELIMQDVVLGPTTDGGYYLIGTRRPLPDLRSVRWSTQQALKDTEGLLAKKGYRISTVALWHDVDVVEDLACLKTHLIPYTPAQVQLLMWLTAIPKVSVIIPVLNEGEYLSQLLTQLTELVPNPEIIVIDGGSHDDTISRCKQAGVKLLQAKLANRALQMNVGADIAKGDILLFLHADSYLTQSAYGTMIVACTNPKLRGGCFSFALDNSQQYWWVRLIELGARWRVKLFKLAYGDQGYFVRQSVFKQIGAFKPLPLMEDIEWFSRLKKNNTIKILNAPLTTSSRRIAQRGWFRSSLLNNVIVLLYICGVSPHTLARLYYGKSTGR